MLLGIPSILSPELLKVLCEMGHGDRIVLADANFPSASIGMGKPVIRCDGHGAAAILDAILTVFPLDTYVKDPVKLMQVVPGDPVETPIFAVYHDIVKAHDARGEACFGDLERFSFYEAAKDAYAIVATGETALYGNLILQKGVVINK